MIKTLLVSTSALLMAASGLVAAPGGHGFAGGGSRGGSPSAMSRPAARAQYSGANRGGGGRYGYRGGRGGYYGHRYFLGGIPYFYDPFLFGFGYGYGYGGYPYGGYYGDDYASGPGYYNGRVNDDRDRDNDDDHGADRQGLFALPKAVQKQLASRGYYKGTIDGEFGTASKAALSHFQRDNNLRVTGRIDPATMKALGFEDRDR